MTPAEGKPITATEIRKRIAEQKPPGAHLWDDLIDHIIRVLKKKGHLDDPR